MSAIAKSALKGVSRRTSVRVEARRTVKPSAKSAPPR